MGSVIYSQSYEFISGRLRWLGLVVVFDGDNASSVTPPNHASILEHRFCNRKSPVRPNSTVREYPFTPRTRVNQP